MIGERLSCGMNVPIWINTEKESESNEGGTVWRDGKVRLKDCIASKKSA
jgi:hypothetical protein